MDALGHDGTEVRELTPDQIEVAVLDRTRTQVRKFKRISEESLAGILTESSPAVDEKSDAESPTRTRVTPATATPVQSSASDTPVAPPADDAPIAPPEDPDDDRPL